MVGELRLTIEEDGAFPPSPLTGEGGPQGRVRVAMRGRTADGLDDIRGEPFLHSATLTPACGGPSPVKGEG
jgi:hypothetical protein